MANTTFRSFSINICIEIVEGYDLTHPVNTLWYAGYWIVAYALLKHKKII